MPEKETLERAQRDKREGKAPTTQAGEFIREEMHHIREGTHGARSAKQAIAIGLSKARRAGVDLPPPRKGQASEKTRKNAQYAYESGHGEHHGRPSGRRSRAISNALKREGHSAAFASGALAPGALGGVAAIGIGAIGRGQKRPPAPKARPSVRRRPARRRGPARLDHHNRVISLAAAAPAV
jgi:hypothetical protein